MKTPQYELDEMFAEWTQKLLWERLQPIPRGVKPKGFAMVGSGAPYYWYLDGNAIDDNEAVVKVYEILADRIGEKPHYARSYAKLGNLRSGRAMLKQIRELMS